jgi:hypothetical protein
MGTFFDGQHEKGCPSGKGGQKMVENPPEVYAYCTQKKGGHKIEPGLVSALKMLIVDLDSILPPA